MTQDSFPVGKLPVAILSSILNRTPVEDSRVILGPGIGLDCAVIDFGDRLLVFKSDPITFVTDEIGWYLVQVNANDIATTGATPLWLLLTALFPEGTTSKKIVQDTADQVFEACRTLGISVIGGHTEITHGISRPILVGTMIGEVHRHRLVTPRGASPGDKVLLTKGVPIEATAILAREFPDHLARILKTEEIEEAQAFLRKPGISILRDTQIASTAGQVTAMHDPTEGGLAGALWEMADASGRSIVVDLNQVPIPSLSRRICKAFDLNPFAAISSGALLLTTPKDDSAAICQAMKKEGILCAEIGYVEEGPANVRCDVSGQEKIMARPERDEIAKVFDSLN